MSGKKIFIIIFILAIIMRLAALLSFAGEKSLIYVNDSLTYLQVSKNIIQHGAYSMEISNTPHPDNFRTPLYPFFLIPFVALNTSLYLPAIVQIIIMSFGAGLVFWLGQKIFNRRVAIIAAVLFALEPFGALISAQIMTEAIFVSLFAPAVFLFALYINNNKAFLFYLASGLLALASLTRPIALPLVILIPLAAWLGKIVFKQSFNYKRTLFSLAIFIAIIFPWVWFNYSKVHTFKFSSVNDMQLYAYHGKIFDAWRGENGAAPNDRLPNLDLSPINNTFNAAAIPPIKAVGVNYIKSHLAQYIYFHIWRSPQLFTDSGYASILNGVPFLHFYLDTSSGGLLEQLSKNFNNSLNMLKNQPALILLGLADVFYILLVIFAIINPLIYYKLNKTWPADKLFLVFIIIIYALLTSPIGGARMRIPVNSLLFILALDTLFLIKKATKRVEHVAGKN